MHIIFVCRSLTIAQKAARIIQNHGIFSAVAKAPQSANPGGCTYGVKIAARNEDAALALLNAAGIDILARVELPGAGERGARR